MSLINNAWPFLMANQSTVASLINWIGIILIIIIFKTSSLKTTLILIPLGLVLSILNIFYFIPFENTDFYVIEGLTIMVLIILFFFRIIKSILQRIKKGKK